MKDLLICVANHSAPDRIQFLRTILEAFANEYALSHDIIVDTNDSSLGITGRENVTVVSHPQLDHPFHLTWQHRQHIRDRIDDYRWFAYFEDDIYLPFANFDHYRTRFMLLWPDYVPCFVRVEKHAGEEWAVDVTAHQQCACVRDRQCALNQPYCAFWIMPQDALKASMGPDFVRLSDSREAAASYPMADLGRAALVQIDDGKVDPRCFAYHLPNNYAPCPTSPHGKIKVSDIFLP